MSLKHSHFVELGREHHRVGVRWSLLHALKTQEQSLTVGHSLHHLPFESRRLLQKSLGLVFHVLLLGLREQLVKVDLMFLAFGTQILQTLADRPLVILHQLSLNEVPRFLWDHNWSSCGYHIESIRSLLCLLDGGFLLLCFLFSEGILIQVYVDVLILKNAALDFSFS